MIPMNPNLDKLRRSPIRVYTNLANATPGCVKLTIGEPDMDTPENIRTAAAAALAAGMTHYAPNQGTFELRRAIADFETARGNPVTEAQVLVTVGASQALYTALTGILSPGDEVIIPAPGFVLYESIVLAAGAVPKFLDLSKTDFQIRGEVLAPLVTEKTRAIILNSPNNPSGAVVSEAQIKELAAILRAAEEKYGHPIYLISDEPYRELAYGVEVPWIPEIWNDTIVCYSYSKSLSLPGERIGYVAVSSTMADRQDIFDAVCGAARGYGYVNAPSLMQRVVEKWHNHDNGRIRIDAGIYAEYTSNHKLWEGLLGYASEKNLGLQLHLAQTQEEVDSCLDRTGLSPAELLRVANVLRQYMEVLL